MNVCVRFIAGKKDVRHTFEVLKIYLNSLITYSIFEIFKNMILNSVKGCQHRISTFFLSWNLTRYSVVLHPYFSISQRVRSLFID